MVLFPRVFIWPLFAALMGFALGGSVFWGFYGPNATIQHLTQTAEHHSAESEPKSKKEETDEALAYYTLWLMIFTGILAFATVGLGAATVGLYLTGEKQIRHNAEAAAAQSRDMEKSLIAANRPWIKVEIAVGGPIFYNVNGANFRLRYVLTNIGRSPAINVNVSPRVVFPILSMEKSSRFDPSGDLRKMISEDKERNASIPFGYSMFPGETIVQDIVVSMSNDDIKKATKLIAAIYPTIIGTVSYRMGLDSEIHQTAFIVEIQRSGVSRPYTTENNKSPSAIWVDEGDVPAEDIRLVRSLIEGGYAD